jgi:hypothetical protein
MDRMSRLRHRFLYDRDIFMTVACLAVILAMPQRAFAWGREGHQSLARFHLRLAVRDPSPAPVCGGTLSPGERAVYFGRRSPFSRTLPSPPLGERTAKGSRARYSSPLRGERVDANGGRVRGHGVAMASANLTQTVKFRISSLLVIVAEHYMRPETAARMREMLAPHLCPR